jgi:hypothetical protein
VKPPTFGRQALPDLPRRRPGTDDAQDRILISTTNLHEAATYECPRGLIQSLEPPDPGHLVGWHIIEAKSIFHALMTTSIDPGSERYPARGGTMILRDDPRAERLQDGSLREVEVTVSGNIIDPVQDHAASGFVPMPALRQDIRGRIPIP